MAELKNTRIFGVLALFMLVSTFCIGFFGIIIYSTTAALIYFIFISLLLILFAYAFCAKCPVRSKCVHVLMGLITQILPGRIESPYTKQEMFIVIIFFTFLVLFPQYWLIQNSVLFLVFWGLFIGECIFTHFTCCKGCGNIYCKLRINQ